MSNRAILTGDIKNLPDCISNDLKCSICEKYLTVLPILLRQSGDSICGRCVPPIDEKLTVVRNSAYERLVSKIIFPCCYEPQGCTFKTEAQILEAHENYCHYRPIKCPFLPPESCDWCGTQTTLLDHYQKCHSSYVVESHPCDVKPPSIAKNMEECLLLSLYDKLFILQIRYAVASAKYSYDVRIIDYPNESQYFQYTFEIITNGKGSYVNECSVLEQDRSILNENTKNQIHMEYLLKFFGRLDYLTFQITIKHREHVIKCTDCYRNVYTHELKHGFCTYCDDIVNLELYPQESKSQQSKCKHSNEGCLYFANKNNVNKHEIWFCEFAENKCTICEVTVKNLFNHYFVDHRGQVFKNKVNMKNLCLNYKYSAVLIVEDVIFVCLWNFTRSFLEIKVISNLPKTDNSNYDCVLKLTNPKSFFSRKYRLPHFSTNGICDWLGIIGYNSNNLVVSTVTEIIENSNVLNKNSGSVLKNVSEINIYNSYNLQLMVVHKDSDE